MDVRTMVKNFTLLDWMIHFGVFANIAVSVYIIWYAYVR